METRKFDLIVIGLGPAGMAVSVMGAEMGLKVCAIERRAIGGECMNIGCIPSKALLKIAAARWKVSTLSEMELSSLPLPTPQNPFGKIARDIKFINDHKTTAMFDKVHLVLGQGSAEFINRNSVRVGENIYSAKRIFIATGTKPTIPPIPGLAEIDFLTNENIFNLTEIPKRITIIGGGAIGSEMAQAFARLGSQVTIVQLDPYLIPVGDEAAGRFVEDAFRKEGIEVLNSRKILAISKEGDEIVVNTDNAEDNIRSEKLLIAAGRTIDLTTLKLENAGVKYNRRGVKVNDYLQTSSPNIYAVGDLNGYRQLTHAAMHQGMLALMNSLLPWPFKRRYKNYVVPWTVFTEPQVSHVGLTKQEIAQLGLEHEEIIAKHEDYGAAIAENAGAGWAKAYISPRGKILGVSIVGEGSGEMIGEWALAIQKKLRVTDIMMLQHSFPTMSFLSKRVAEIWATNRIRSNVVHKLVRLLW